MVKAVVVQGVVEVAGQEEAVEVQEVVEMDLPRCKKYYDCKSCEANSFSSGSWHYGHNTGHVIVMGVQALLSRGECNSFRLYAEATCLARSDRCRVIYLEWESFSRE